MNTYKGLKLELEDLLGRGQLRLVNTYKGLKLYPVGHLSYIFKVFGEYL